MSLSLYCRHTSKCSQGRSRHERTYESDELRRGFKACQCPIQFEGKVKGVGFLRKSTEKISWDEAKSVAFGWETAGNHQPPALPQPPFSESAGVATKNDEPVSIERAVKEFLADIEARKMDDSTRRKYCTMLKQLRAYADQRGFLLDLNRPTASITDQELQTDIRKRLCPRLNGRIREAAKEKAMRELSITATQQDIDAFRAKLQPFDPLAQSKLLPAGAKPVLPGATERG